MSKELYNQYVEKLQKIQDINASIALLHWDHEVNAPKKGAPFRSRQLATLSAMSHEMIVDTDLGVLLEQLNADKSELSETEARNVELTLEDYQKATKLPSSFVKELSLARSAAYQAWIAARKAEDFSLYKEALSNIVALKRKEAKLLGYEGHPYNALLNDYEKGATVAQLDVLFGDVRKQLVEFAKVIRESGTATENGFLHEHYDKDKQWQLGLDLLKQMGYDFDAGRQDISEHPFTTSFAPMDVRVTTRISETDPLSMIGSCIHEGGHGLYEQGLKAENYGLPAGFATSLGIHESQSRLWENNVGLGFAYWKNNFPRLQKLFPEQLADVTAEQFYKGANQLKPNLIRVDADEIHYHLHVLIRYEIEKGLIEGSIEVENLDQIWNEKYKEFMGVEVPNAKKGVLQDVHWCEGLFGYFPTYSLGSFYAAQFYTQAKKDIPNLEASIEEGNMQPLLDWLREHIHQYGRLYTSEEFCKRITGEGLSLKYFMDYAKRKYSYIYNLKL
ncbi:MAG: carboxypeptidase M32 [Aureispira sp.]|nr:carboxypeptidase M32 [Aureispira sp.]